MQAFNVLVSASAAERLAEARRFISSQQAGVRVHLFSMNEVEPWEKAARYPVLERIQARCVYLPKATSSPKARMKEFRIVGSRMVDRAAIPSPVLDMGPRSPISA